MLGVLLCVLLVGMASCAARRTTASSAPLPSAAQALAREGNALLATDPQRAEQLLRESLAIDPFRGQVHNNLGVALLARDSLAEAAAAFDEARRLLPSSPEPRLNLGMVYERAGRTTEALEYYSTALEVAPDHLPAMQALARLQLHSGRRTDDTARLLKAIALKGTDAAWRSWGREQLAKLASTP